MRTIPKNIVFIGILAILALTAIPAFSALAAASVQTSSASAIGETSATLNAQVYGGSEPIYYRFEFGTSPALGNTTSFELVYGSANISATVFSLSPNTIYYYRAVIQDRFGKLIGGVPLAFMTGSNGRAGTMLGNGYNGNFNNGNNNNVNGLVQTDGVEKTGNTSAVLTGLVNPSGVVTGYYFEYGTSVSLGNSTPMQAVGNSGTLEARSRVTGLAAGTTYYYRIVGTTGNGLVYGEILSFKAGTSTGNSGTTVNRPTTPVAAATTTQPFGLAQIFSIFSKKSCFTASQEFSDSTPSPDGIFTLKVKAENKCNTVIASTTLKVTVPDRIDILSSDYPNPTSTGRDISFYIGDIPAESEASVTIQAKVAPTAPVKSPLTFVSLITYKDPSGNSQSITLSSTATVQKTFGAGILGAFKGTNWLFNLILILIVASLAYWIFSTERKDRRPLGIEVKNGNGKGLMPFPRS